MSKGIMGNGDLRFLDRSCKVFQRDKRKTAQTRVLILPFPSSGNTEKPKSSDDKLSISIVIVSCA